MELAPFDEQKRNPDNELNVSVKSFSARALIGGHWGKLTQIK